MKTQTTTLRPGLLVVLKTSITGNVKYDRVDLDEARDGDTEMTEWQTKRTISDVKEWQAARKAVTLATAPIKKVCRQTAFGLMCPLDDKDDLQEAIDASEQIVDKFNGKANLTHVNVNVMRGEVAADDLAAIKSMNAEVRKLLASMETGLSNLDVKAVRAAAKKAREIGQMLTPEAQGRVGAAIELARKAASNIAKAGDDAGVLNVDTRAIRKIAQQRTSFLDLGDEPVEIKKPKSRARSVDLSA